MEYRQVPDDHDKECLKKPCQDHKAVQANQRQCNHMAVLILHFYVQGWRSDEIEADYSETVDDGWVEECLHSQWLLLQVVPDCG